jgi:hypothetical protein
MNKEFIPYTEALALKELGFDEPCLAYWDNDKLFIIDRNSERIQKNSNYKDIFEGIISAPTYSQAFSWLRKNYGYWCYIKEATKGTCRFYIEKFDEKFFTSDIIDSYEEAELECLKKLIEIVKQK